MWFVHSRRGFQVCWQRACDRHLQSQIRRRLADGLDYLSTNWSFIREKKKLFILSAFFCSKKEKKERFNKQYAYLKGSKIIGKSSLRYVPLIGWCWIFAESIFIRRKWDVDKNTLTKDLNAILEDYPENHFFNVKISLWMFLNLQIENLILFISFI